jgi:hypothetical protein
MGTRDPRVDAYIAKAADFARPILTHIRATVHAYCPDVAETMKWSMPFYEYQGGILCNMAAFKQHCAFGFWLGKLLAIDAASETAMGQFGRITAIKDLPTDKAFAKLIKQAMKLHDAGAKLPDRAKPAAEKKILEVPPAFAAAVKKNRKASATFEAFSYSKKKDYVAWYTEAKSDATREKRLAQAIEWMAEGKARHWKYENC